MYSKIINKKNNMLCFTFQHILSEVATVTGGLAEIFMSDVLDITLYLIQTGDWHEIYTYINHLTQSGLISDNAFFEGHYPAFNMVT